MAAVNAACLVVLFALATVQYDAVLSGLVRDRLSVVAAELAAPFQAVAELGLPIESLRDVDALLMRTKQSAPDILGIYLFDPSGAIVRSTEPEGLAEIGDATLAAIASNGREAVFQETQDALLVTNAITGIDGGIAGGVVVRYGTAGKSMQVEALAGRLGFLSAAILLVSLCAGLVVMRIALAGHIRVFDGLLATYDRFERQAWRGSRPNEPSAEPLRGFGIDTQDLFALLEESEARYQAENPSRRADVSKGNAA